MALPAVDIQAAQNRIETLARSQFQIHGYSMPDGDVIGRIVSRAMAVISRTNCFTLIA